ncbi:MAG: hypothetical protein J1G01_01040 [Clostridiales bacterium]|nr:hypothetical protein [Clostridiales bacterium]
MDKILLNEYISLISDSSFKLTAERLTFKSGVRADLKGCDLLAEAVILYGTETCTAFCEIYRILGELHGQRAKSVMRSIAYAIMHAYDISARLSDMIGVTVKATDIHNGLVISILGRIFKNPDLAVYK